MSLPSPGFQTKTSSPAPSKRRVVAAPTHDGVVLVAAVEDLAALAADERVGAGAAVEDEPDNTVRDHARVDRVGAAERIDREDVRNGFGAGHRDARRKAADADHVAGGREADDVAARRGIHRHGVSRPVAARANAEVDVDLRHARAGQVIDRDGVGTAHAGEADALDPVEVQGDAAGAAEQTRPRAVGRDVDGLGGAAPLKTRVSAPASPSTRSLPSPVLPDEHVVAVAERRGVVAAPADDRVVVLVAEQRVGAIARDEAVVADAGEDGVGAVPGGHRVAALVGEDQGRDCRTAFTTSSPNPPTMVSALPVAVMVSAPPLVRMKLLSPGDGDVVVAVRRSRCRRRWSIRWC